MTTTTAKRWKPAKKPSWLHLVEIWGNSARDYRLHIAVVAPDKSMRIVCSSRSATPEATVCALRWLKLARSASAQDAQIRSQLRKAGIRTSK